MNAAIDIGNQRVKLALFSGRTLQSQTVMDTGAWEEIFAWLANHSPENTILSSVGPLPGSHREAELRTSGRTLILNPDTPLPIKNAYRSPETLGKDRLAAVVGASAHYPGRPCLVVDAGTCITIDLLDQGGVFQGGSISPGLSMRLKAMHAFTAKLPLLGLAEAGPLPGKSTAEAMRLGAQTGAALEVEGFVEHYRRRYDDLVVLLTGGDAEILAKALKSEIFVHPNLVLLGLNTILLHNVEPLA